MSLLTTVPAGADPRDYTYYHDFRTKPIERSVTRRKRKVAPRMPMEVHDVAQVPITQIPRLIQQNEIVKFRFGMELPLSELAAKIPGCEYNRHKFTSVIARLRTLRVTGLIFASGKCVLSGCKDPNSARTAAQMFVRILRKHGFPVILKDVMVHNKVFRVSTGFPVNLHAVKAMFNEYAMYNPAVFPGVRIELPNPMVWVLVFPKGEVVVTGSYTAADAAYAFNTFVYPRLLKARIITQ